MNGFTTLLALFAFFSSVSGGEDALTGRLVHCRLTDNVWQVWETDLSTGDSVQVTHGGVGKRYPTLDPQGRVCFQTTTHELLVVTEPQGVTAPLFEKYWPCRDIRWSPDGARVAFSRIRTDLVDAANLFVAELATGDTRRLTAEAGLQYTPAWSPDGERIAFVSGQGFRLYDIHVMDADGGNRVNLTENEHHEFLPAWSPDGEWIAYTSDESGDFEIHLMRPDGTQKRQLTKLPGLDTRPSWSPDGRHIAFVRRRAGGLGLWCIRADGTGLFELTPDEVEACDPCWR